jgi:hypothetical protein
MVVEPKSLKLYDDILIVVYFSKKKLQGESVW